jgi:hypothetical protein
VPTLNHGRGITFCCRALTTEDKVRTEAPAAVESYLVSLYLQQPLS